MKRKSLLVFILIILVFMQLTSIVLADDQKIDMISSTNGTSSLTTKEASGNENSSINDTAKTTDDGYVEGYDMKTEKVVPLEGYVEGYEMEKEKAIEPNVESFSFSKVDIVASLFVIAGFGAVFLVGATTVVAIYTLSRKKKDN